MDDLLDRRRQRLNRLRSRFIAVNLRSRSLRLIRATRSGALDLHRLASCAAPGLQALLRKLGSEHSELDLLGLPPGGGTDEQQEVAADIAYLHHRAHEAWLETGARDLALGWPILEGSSASGVWLRAPLLLYPADLALVHGPGQRWVLRSLGLPELNESLAQTLGRLCGVRLTLDELLQDDDDRVFAVDDPTWRGMAACLTRLGLPLAPAGVRVPALLPLEQRPLQARESAPPGLFTLQHHLVLGRFPAAASALVGDYDELLAVDPTDANLGLAADLLQVDEEATTQQTAPSAQSLEQEPQGLSGLRQWLVLDSDSSQDAVLRWVEQPEARGLVVQGPPGTGKSQLIANLVAAGLAQGWRILLVCQKRAALDVVADRLSSLGLREPIALVHDIHRDRVEICAGIASTLESAAQHRPEDTTAEEDGRAFSRILSRLRGRVEASQGSFELLARHLDGRPPLAELDERALEDPGHDLPDLRDVAHEASEEEVGRALPRIPGYSRQTSDLAAPHPLAVRGDWATAGDQLIACSFTAVEQTLATIDELSRVRGGHMTPHQSLAHSPLWTSATPLLDLLAARDVESTRRFELFWVWTGGRAEHGQWAQVVELLDRARQTLRPTPEELVLERRATLEQWIVELETLKQVARRWYRIFLPRFWRLRRLPGRILDLCNSWTEELSSTSTAVVDLADLCRRALDWQALIAALPTDNPFFDYGLVGRLEQIDAALGDLRQQHDWVEAIHGMHRTLADEGAAYGSLPTLGPDAPDPWQQPFFTAAIADWRRAQLADALQEQLKRARGVIDDGFLRRLESMVEDVGRGQLDDSLLRLRQMLDARSDVPRLRQIDQMLAGEPGWVRAFLRGWRSNGGGGEPATDAVLALERAWRQLALAGRPRTAVEAPLVEPDALQRLADDLDECRDRARGGVLAAYHCTLRTSLQSTSGRPLRRLEAEARKRRRRLTLRQLIGRYWDEGLSVVRPVWFGSPETVAALFPPRPGIFDLIIFDEASQCPVESAVPVLVRGQRTLIAGDEKQMPPSHFFQAVDDDPDGDEGEEAVLASQSLLGLARIAHANIVLRWHYRSRHESLIAFSNSAYYGRRLLTAPGTGAATGPFSGLHWQQLSDGLWQDGTNQVEARAVVDLLRRVLAWRGPDGGSLTVGVVTFNLPQADLIRLRLHDAAAREPDGLGRLLEADRARAPVDQLFVRNLENVQGDERDVIIFSVGYAPAEPGGRVHARFGPLGQTGGENRLNVAITRARRGAWVLCSFDPDRLEVASARNPGPRLLRLYLQYVRAESEHTGAVEGLLQQAALLTGEPGAVAGAHRADRRLGAKVRESLARALAEATGRPPVERHGLGTLRIDLAYPDRRLAIDCGEFLALADPLTRDVYTPRFWRRMGWRLVRVTPGMWLEQRESVLAGITRLVQ